MNASNSSLADTNLVVNTTTLYRNTAKYDKDNGLSLTEMIALIKTTKWEWISVTAQILP